MRPDAPWHAHIYFTDADRAEAAALREEFHRDPAIRSTGHMATGPVGPHPVPQFEVHFLAKSRAAVIARIEASGLRALVHPLTDDDLADHTALGQWIGQPLELDLSVLDPPGVNQGVARFGMRDF
jgi:aromatic ring-cleaving dioxygenase